MLTEDQFVEIVTDAIEKHISRDNTVVAEDQRWEAENAAKKISDQLRLNGVSVPRCGMY